ncbi:hypothetical protein [Saccharothrix syringae]|uniref:Uncharacterized protein n=1 Tax=Saccharothrix syringae TaxID=103733 RepID=A0A5Q0HAQ8_SACSY|nr:hypothetical protein [Saccharothrix syringae]QFZ23301.1 hypothetical protein EKG83_42935 [Saccharothrix syringae]
MTRWLVLHARARRVPAATATAVVATGLVGLLAQPGGDPRLTSFAAAVGVAAVAVGFGGHDPELERTAAFGWPPRRAAHLLLGAALVAGLLLAVGLVADPVAPGAFVLRDVVGLAGLAALGACLFGSRAAWAPPVAWTGVTFVVPAGEDWADHLLGWPVQPAGTTAATAAAVVLGCAGLLAYSAFGCRR